MARILDRTSLRLKVMLSPLLLTVTFATAVGVLFLQSLDAVDRLTGALGRATPELQRIHLTSIRQTMSLIDVLNYRAHIYDLGGYAASGDSAGDALELV